MPPLAKFRLRHSVNLCIVQYFYSNACTLDNVVVFAQGKLTP